MDQNNAKKKILIFSIAYYPFVGGAEIAVKEITDRMPDIDWSMVTCALEKNLPEEEKIGNITVYRVKCPKYLFPIVACAKAMKLQKTHHFDAVWSIMAAYAGFASLFFSVLQKKVPYILTLQEGDPISYIKRKVWFVYPAFKSIFRRAYVVQAISEFLASFGREMGHKKPIEVISNGVNLECFSKIFTEEEKEKMKRRLDKKPNDIFLVTSSRLVKKNAVDDIIASLKFMPERISLIVIGKGPEGCNLQKQADALGLSGRVKFIGFVVQEEIPRYFSACDIFVRPSRSEGFGNSFIEAMAARLPVVTTPIGGIVDFIDDKETGVFCAPDNPKSVAEEVLSLVDDGALKEHIISKAFDRVSAKYSWDYVAWEMKRRVFERI